MLMSSINAFKLIVSAALITLLFSCAGQQSTRTSSQDVQETGLSSTGNIGQADRELYRTGITALYNDELSSARHIFTGFIRQHPDLAGAYSNLALIEYKQEKFEEAIKLTDKAISLNPDQAQAYHIRAQSYVKLGKIHEARADYTKAVELKPDYIQAQYNLALLYDIYLQDIENAIKHYELYMALNKKQDQATVDWISHLKGTLNNG